MVAERVTATLLPAPHTSLHLTFMILPSWAAHLYCLGYEYTTWPTAQTSLGYIDNALKIFISFPFT